jgi:hypothetical protein
MSRVWRQAGGDQHTLLSQLQGVYCTRSEMFGADVVWLGARLYIAAKIVVPPHFHERRLDFHCAPPPVKLVAVQH